MKRAIKLEASKKIKLPGAKGYGFFFKVQIQNCRSSTKIGRKEKIERFFFPRDLAGKKNRDEKIAIFFKIWFWPKNRPLGVFWAGN